MRHTFEETRCYLECDGCGYALTNTVLTSSSEAENLAAPITLKVGDKEFHFHDAIEHGYPCFEYWLTHKTRFVTFNLDGVLKSLMGNEDADKAKA